MLFRALKVQDSNKCICQARRPLMLHHVDGDQGNGGGVCHPYIVRRVIYVPALCFGMHATIGGRDVQRRQRAAEPPTFALQQNIVLTYSYIRTGVFVIICISTLSALFEWNALCVYIVCVVSSWRCRRGCPFASIRGARIR